LKGFLSTQNPLRPLLLKTWGFRRIADVPGIASFLERGTPTFTDVLQMWIDETKASQSRNVTTTAIKDSQDIAGARLNRQNSTDTVVESIVMNANPFTLGIARS